MKKYFIASVVAVMAFAFAAFAASLNVEADRLAAGRGTGSRASISRSATTPATVRT
jgi:hypothetical protein